MLLTVPNIAEGADDDLIDEAGKALTFGAVKLLDIHSDADHSRTVLSAAGPDGDLLDGLIALAEVTTSKIDMNTYRGIHPCVGALDVAPVVYLSESCHLSAAELAGELAERVARELEIPVFFYGDLGEGRERSFFRKGGLAQLKRRLAAGELTPDFGPSMPHASAGALLVTARPPLVAFNLELSGGGLEDAQEIARGLRVANRLNAIGVELKSRNCLQLSFNVLDPYALPLGEVVEKAEVLAKSRGLEIACAEIVGLVPEAALKEFPAVEIRNFDGDSQIIERVIAG